MGTSRDVAKVIPITSDTNITPNVTPLEALLGEITRTTAKIAWLETIVEALPLSDVFGDNEIIEQTESEGGREGQVRGVGPHDESRTARVKWLLANERERKQTQVKRRLGIHPAITLLMDERKHLVNVTTRCLAIGIKRDHIELSKRQGEQMLEGMLAFAELSGLDPESDVVKSTLAQALSRVVEGA